MVSDKKQVLTNEFSKTSKNHFPAIQSDVNKADSQQSGTDLLLDSVTVGPRRSSARGFIAIVHVRGGGGA